MSRLATDLARVDVCRGRVGRAGRAISSLVLGFTFALSLTFLERVNLHPVIICTPFHFQMTRSDSLQSFGRSDTIATKLFEERDCWHMYPTADCF